MLLKPLKLADRIVQVLLFLFLAPRPRYFLLTLTQPPSLALILSSFSSPSSFSSSPSSFSSPLLPAFGSYWPGLLAASSVEMYCIIASIDSVLMAPGGGTAPPWPPPKKGAEGAAAEL